MSIELNPDIIFHTHSKIRNRFSGCAKTIDETLEEIKSKVLNINNLPMITVEYNGINYYSLNNRRLYVIKRCKELGLIETIKVRLIFKDRKEYRKNTYSYSAKII